MTKQLQHPSSHGTRRGTSTDHRPLQRAPLELRSIFLISPKKESAYRTPCPSYIRTLLSTILTVAHLNSSSMLLSGPDTLNTQPVCLPRSQWNRPAPGLWSVMRPCRSLATCCSSEPLIFGSAIRFMRKAFLPAWRRAQSPGFLGARQGNGTPSQGTSRILIWRQRLGTLRLQARSAGWAPDRHRKEAGKLKQVQQPGIPKDYQQTQSAYTILYYTILYYTILYYTILYYTILYYTILYYAILYYTMLYYAILCYTMLY